MSVRSTALDGPETRVAPPDRLPPDQPPPSTPHEGALSSPVRKAGYAAVLTVLAFIQGSGLMVADTKFDLLTAPGRFLARGLQLWDPDAAFGQVPDQSYGYAWPMGPFFALGHLAQMPPWMIQRLWWALLLCLAFFGMLRLLEELLMGSELTRLVASLVFVLTPRMTTLVGVVSVEVWPMALAPWVLLPLVRGSRRGSVRRAAAMSALVVCCCGGVNAVAVAAVLPLGVIWLLTREPGPRRWRLLGWWTFFTVLATAWWSGPLLLLGRYAPPFLDYIENATITTLPTDLTRSLLGISDWVAYFGGPDFGSGLHVVGTPYLLVDAALVAGLGLLGICLPGHPHRRFLVWGLLTGLMLVGFGYARDLPGFFAGDRLSSLDFALAPFRNVHKFDVVLRIPLVLGLAHALTELPKLIHRLGSVLTLRVFRAAVGAAVFALLTPWLYGVIPASDGVRTVPSYWTSAATWLAGHDDGSVALELPAAPFGVYTWGNSHDDILQGLATSPWAVRNVVPLAQPGNVVFLDAVTRAVESGQPQPRLASYLAANGVGALVVRNDLDRILTGAPDPTYVKAVLSATPGLTLVKSFGPLVSASAYGYVDNADRTRIVQNSGISDLARSIDVYQVRDPQPAALSSVGEVLLGDPSSPLDSGLADVAPVPPLLAADASGPTAPITGQVLTDDLKRREMNFPAVRWNESSTLTAGEPFRLSGKEQSHRLVSDDARWDTTVSWSGGVSGVEASTSQAYADAVPPLVIGAHPGAVFDGDPDTAWLSARDADPKQQWWQADFTHARTVSRVGVSVAVGSVPLTSLVISGGGQSRTVPAPRPGRDASYPVGLPSTSTLRISPVYAGPLLTGSVGLSEVHIDGLRPQRYLDLPAPLSDAPVDVVSLSRDPDRFPCVEVQSAFPCDPALREPGEDGDMLARRLSVPDPSRFTVAATASLRRTDAVWSTLLRHTGVRVVVPHQGEGDPAQGSGALADGDPSTTWVATSSHPLIRLRLPHRTRLSQLALDLQPGAAASLPQRLLVRSGHRQQVVDLDTQGRAPLPHWRVRDLSLRVESTYPAFTPDGQRFSELGPGISELRINGRGLTHDVFRPLDVPCGQGPKLAIGGSIFDTSAIANVRSLLRGAQVPLHVCALPGVTPYVVLDGAATVLAPPTGALRVDSVTLERPGAALGTDRPATVHRDAGGLPTSVDLPARTATSVLSLTQNVNPGWQATLDGHVLAAQRVDGWQQGWVVPAGPAARVDLRFTPTRLFDGLLILGAVLALGCAVAATPLRLRATARGTVRDLPPLGAAPGRWLDAVLVVAAAGFFTGWVGLAVLAAGAVVAWRFRSFDGWGYAAGLALLVAVLGLTWGPVKSQSWALSWAQVWAMVAVAAVSVALVRPARARGSAPAPAPGTPGRPWWRPARSASSSAGSSAAGSGSRSSARRASPPPA
ncbi:alpha-(1-_3)-arabinofuranosyltransferase domain-containing protein [Nocardioides cynanchi]|uniref:alpha-(1->3)-arabinofuranosyltransferase domain-containing protein n=1 Tax=Nocardioides cynanchi TaxID=2558918 RepID=UPI0012460C6D|nr:alpha-(1->3)-arabinofuranosyltransferase family protein [Nocardioides cynanchi]